MVLNGKARVPGFVSEPASGPTEETFTKKTDAVGQGLVASMAEVATMIAAFAEFAVPALTSQMSSPAEVHASVGDEWSQKLFAAEIVIDGAVNLTRRSFCVLQEITFPPALPAEPPPRSPPATSYSTPNALPVMTLFSTLLPAPPATKARPVPEPDPPLSTIRFPVITWPVETSIYTPTLWVPPVTVLFRRVTVLLRRMSPRRSVNELLLLMIVNPAIVDPVPGSSATPTLPAVAPGASPPPTMLVGVFPPPLLVSSPISNTPAGTVIGNASLLFRVS